MTVTGVTVGIPVRDLAASRQWYERALGLGAPDLEPADGVVEYAVGGTWLQLGEDPTHAVMPGHWVFRLGVSDVRTERDRLLALGLDVGELVIIEGVIAYFDFPDPDGNQLSYYTELE